MKGYESKRQMLTLLLLLGFGSAQDCPPPVGQFITLNSRPYTASSRITVRARKERGALVARLKVIPLRFHG